MLILKLKGHAGAGEFLGCEIPFTLVKTKSRASPLCFFGFFLAALRRGNLVAANFCSAKMHRGCLDVYGLTDTQLYEAEKNQLEPQHLQFQKEIVFV